MRTALAVTAALAAASCGRTAPERVYITIGADAVGTARELAHDGDGIEVLGANADFAVVAIDPGEIDALSEQMHERFHRCGGFMVHESLEEAQAVLGATDEERIDYTLDRAAMVGTVLPALDSSRILGTIRELSGMQNRYYQSQSGANASLWLRDRWRSFSARTDVTVELFDHGYAQKSVILTIPGTTRAGEVIVLGGHLDSIAVGGAKSVAPGADDDASGIATLTEIARVLLVKDLRPERTIKFIAYAAEEVGLRGSLGIVREFKKRGVHVVGALQLDMTNYQGSDKDIWLITDHTNAAQNEFLATMIDAYVGASWAWDRCGYACSDHASWHRAKVPASMAFESRFRDSNKAIHTRKDTLEMSKGNADHALKFARLGAAYAIELGKGELGASATTTATSTPSTGRTWELLVLAALGLAGGVALRRRARRSC